VSNAPGRHTEVCVPLSPSHTVFHQHFIDLLNDPNTYNPITRYLWLDGMSRCSRYIEFVLPNTQWSYLYDNDL